MEKSKGLSKQELRDKLNTPGLSTKEKEQIITQNLKDKGLFKCR